jgi:hypothetical protein
MVMALDPVRSPPAMALLANVDLSERAQKLSARTGTARAYFDELLLQGCLTDAVAVMCRLLPRQYCLAWAADCVREDISSQQPPDRDEWTRFAAVDRFLRAPADDARAMCAELAERAGYKTPVAWLAAGAGWTGGSLAPPGTPQPIPPPDNLTGIACSACVILLAARVPEQMDERLLKYMQRALAMFATPSGGA